MALVMLPCDLPWWDAVKVHLNKIVATKNTLELIGSMQKIYELCNVSLDPDEDKTDPHQFVGFLNFLDNDLTSEERCNFLNKTLPNLASRAMEIKQHKPSGGLHFSLQQQPDYTELEYLFISSLLANAFFSTFPKRTSKSHPTLQNFNFANFFKCLTNNVQKSKLKSILYYFDWLENNDNCNGHMKIFRQVMSSKDWLTIEDWLECSLPLCTMTIKHEGKLERSDADSLQVCFVNAKIGESVFHYGDTQECISLVTMPELLTTLLNVEALEDNEVLRLEKVRHISIINDPKNRATLDKLPEAREVNICCLDADNYKKLPISQYEEDNILRELNKCLLAFQQKSLCNNATSIFENNSTVVSYNHYQRRLSPIGECLNLNQTDSTSIPLILQQSCSTSASGTESPNTSIINLFGKVKDAHLHAKEVSKNETLVHNRRGRFIVLGSSGECLPVTRKSIENEQDPSYSSCESSEEEFHTAKTSLTCSMKRYRRIYV